MSLVNGFGFSGPNKTWYGLRQSSRGKKSSGDENSAENHPQYHGIKLGKIRDSLSSIIALQQTILRFELAYRFQFYAAGY